MANNKKNKLGTWLIAYFIAAFFKHFIGRITGFRYNMFSDEFNIYKLLLDLSIFLIPFMVVYYLALSFRRKPSKQ